METIVHSDNDFATVAFLRIQNAVLERKSEVPLLDVKVPALLGDDSVGVRDVVSRSPGFSKDVPISSIEPVDTTELRNPGNSTKRIGSWVAVTNIQREVPDNPVEISIEKEVQECFYNLQSTYSSAIIFSPSYRLSFSEHLAQYSLLLSNCANINIFLSSMDLFARVNAVYATFFGTSPPARACVAVDLTFPVRVKLDCVAYVERPSTNRQALHVQGLSYWAPANIGPYSQAITVRRKQIMSIS